MTLAASMPEALATRGFVDVRESHSWNEVHCECRLAEDLAVTVWKREWSGFRVILENPSYYERQVSLKEVRDISEALPLIDALLALKGDL